MELSEIDVVQPNILIVSRARELKRELYEQRGVPVYSLVDPEALPMTEFEFENGAYRETGSHHDEVGLSLAGLAATADLTQVW